MSVAKALVQLLMTVLAAVVPAMLAGPLDTGAWINVVILAAGAVTVYTAANIPGFAYAKLICSAIAAVAVLLSSSIAGGLNPAEVIQLILAAAAALGVGAIPNSTQAVRTA